MRGNAGVAPACGAGRTGYGDNGFDVVTRDEEHVL